MKKATVIKERLLPWQDRTTPCLRGEHWLDVPGFEGYYEASDFGRVRSVDRVIPHPRLYSQTVKGRILSQSVAKNKNIKTGDAMIDLRVSLAWEGQCYYYNVRRLIYLTFIGPIDYAVDGMYVINADGDGYNNRLRNLRLVSKRDKQLRVFARGRQDSYLQWADRTQWKKPYGGTTRRKPVEQWKNGKRVKRFESITAASLATKYGEKEIIMVAKGVWKQYKGFEWKYA